MNNLDFDSFDPLEPRYYLDSVFEFEILIVTRFDFLVVISIVIHECL